MHLQLDSAGVSSELKFVVNQRPVPNAMNQNIPFRFCLPALFLGLAAASGSLVSDLVSDQTWDFETAANPALAAYTNSHGVPNATIALGIGSSGWLASSSFGTNTGLWDLGEGGTITLNIPNSAGLAADVSLEVDKLVGGPLSGRFTYTVPGATLLSSNSVFLNSGGLADWYRDTTTWRLAPSPGILTPVVIAPTEIGIVDRVRVAVADPCVQLTSAGVVAVTVPAGTDAHLNFTNLSGIVCAQALTADNCVVHATAYDTQGNALTPHPILVPTGSKTNLPVGTVRLLAVATKLDYAERAVVNVMVHDVCGRGVSIDPIITTLEITEGNTVRQHFDDLMAAEYHLHVLNGRPGLRWIEIDLNGRIFRLDPLEDGQVVNADLRDAMVEGDNNLVTLTAHGELGSSAFLALTDTPAGEPQPITEIVRLAVGRVAGGMRLSWPETLFGWRLEAATSPTSEWTSVEAEPTPLEGRWTVDLPASSAPRFFRLNGPAEHGLSRPAASRYGEPGKRIRLFLNPQHQRAYGHLHWGF